MDKSKTYFNEYRNFFIHSAFCGLWPSWKSSKYTILLLIYSFFQITYIIVFFLFAIWNFKLPNATLSVIIGHSIFWSILFTHLVVIIEALVNRNAQLRFIEKFASIDRLFKTKLHVVISYDKEKRSIFSRLIVLLVFLFFIRIGLTVHLNYRNQADIYWYQCILSIWIVRTRSNQVLVFVLILRARLHYIFEKLNEIRIGYNLYSRRINQWTIVHDANAHFVLDSIWTKDSIYDRLMSLKQIYGKLYELCEQINNLFGLSLLTIIAQSFMDITTNAYWIFLTIQSLEQDIPRAIDCIFLLVPNVVSMVILSFYCSTCSCYVRQ